MLLCSVLRPGGCALGVVLSTSEQDISAKEQNRLSFSSIGIAIGIKLFLSELPIDQGWIYWNRIGSTGYLRSCLGKCKNTSKCQIASQKSNQFVLLQKYVLCGASFGIDQHILNQFPIINTGWLRHPGHTTA